MRCLVGLILAAGMATVGEARQVGPGAPAAGAGAAAGGVTGAAVGAVSGAGVSAGSGFGFAGGGGGFGYGAVGSFSSITYNPPIVLFATPDGGIQPYAPPLIVMGQGGGFFPPTPALPVPFQSIDGNGDVNAAIGPPVPGRREDVFPRPWSPPRQVRKVSADQVETWMTYGDNLFRAGNLARAEDRYEQAQKARPGSSRPRARLAQVAVARGDYGEAASRLREAHAADPGWLVAPDDVQALWPEPRDFAAMLGRIESHLQAHPEDRDAWLVLGAQLVLSGRRDRAADVLARLTDRPPEPALALLLKASSR